MVYLKNLREDERLDLSYSPELYNGQAVDSYIDNSLAKVNVIADTKTIQQQQSTNKRGSQWVK